MVMWSCLMTMSLSNGDAGPNGGHLGRTTCIGAYNTFYNIALSSGLHVHPQISQEITYIFDNNFIPLSYVCGLTLRILFWKALFFHPRKSSPLGEEQYSFCYYMLNKLKCSAVLRIVYFAASKTPFCHMHSFSHKKAISKIF